MKLLLQHIRQSQVRERHSRTGLRWLETSFHYIGGEEEKSEKEPLRLWGYVDDEKKQIVPAASPVITCQCIRVPVLNGHTAAVFVKFKKNPTKEQLIEALEKFSGVPQDLGFQAHQSSSSRYCEEDNRPQVALDVDYEHGMGINVGRLREDTVYDWKFVGLLTQHSTWCSRWSSALCRAS